MRKKEIGQCRLEGKDWEDFEMDMFCGEPMFRQTAEDYAAEQHDGNTDLKEMLIEVRYKKETRKYRIEVEYEPKFYSREVSV